MLRYWILLAILAITGCSESITLTAGPRPIVEVPAMNLPAPLREWNWVDAGGSGSCVHASTVMHLRWQNQMAIAEWWRKAYAGGETDSSIRAKLDQAGIMYAFTRQAAPQFLEWASSSRRGCIIWYYPAHCVHFCGFHRGKDGREYATLLDNNRIEKFINVEKTEFLRGWAGYGGFALMTLGQKATVNRPAETFGPAPPPLVPAFVRRY